MKPNVYKDTKSNSYIIDFWYTDEHGIRRRYKRSAGKGLNEKEARQRAKALHRELERDRRTFLETFVAPPPQVEAVAFSGLAARWYDEEVMVRCKPSTRRTHDTIVRIHLVPFFGDREVRSITVADVYALRAKVSAGGASEKTLNNVVSALSAILNYAIKPLGILDKNVVREVPPVKVRDQGFMHLSAEETRQFVEVARETEPTYHPLFAVALMTGLRQGELLALQWDDVDLDNGRLHVRRSIYNGQLGAPKSGKGRVVPLSDEVIQVLEAARHDRGPYVFCRPDGAPLTGNQVKNPFRRVAVRVGKPKLRFHDCRHTFASLLVASGVQLQAIQSMLGHAEIQMTMRYAHLAPTANRDAVRQLGASVFGLAAK